MERGPWRLRTPALALAASAGFALLAAAPAFATSKPTSLSVSCPSTTVGVATECTVVVKDTEGVGATTPKESVTLESAGGTFTPEAKCELKEVVVGESHCSVQFVPSVAGPDEVKAKYAGDAGHAASEEHTSVNAAKRTAKVTLGCSPVDVGQASECTATVKDESAGEKSTPINKVKFPASSEGAFSASECTLTEATLGESRCKVEFTPHVAGAPKIEAKYGGDSVHSAAAGETEVSAAKRSTSASVSCAPAVEVGQASTCTATVTDNAGGEKATPLEKVAFSANGHGTLSAPECALAEIASGQASCSVQFTPTVAGPDKVSAEYLGDSEHQAKAAEGLLEAGRRATALAVSCAPPVQVGQLATCTVTVTDIAAGNKATAEGTVTFASNGAGSFSPARTCTLQAVEGHLGESACLLGYTPTEAGSGTHVITAVYGGDPTHAESHGEASLSVSGSSSSTQPPATTTTTTTTGGSTTPPPGPPRCRLSAKEQWRAVGSKRHPREMPVLLVPYTCDQNATVKIEGLITISAGGHGTKKVKGGTVKLLPGTSAAHAGSPAPAVVLALPSTVAKAIVAGAKTIAAVTFVVRNSNGAGAATLKLTLVPQAHKRKTH